MTQPKKPASQKPKKVKQPLLDPAKVKEKMRRADAKRFDETLERYEGCPLPVSMKLKNEGGRKWTNSYQGDDQDQLVGQLRMHAAFGSMSQPFIDTMLAELMTIWDANGGISEKSYNAAIAVLDGARPQNEIEAMLVVQMIAANEAALRATSMVGKCDWFPQSMGFGSLANKFMRTFTAQAEALAKLRRGGEQVVKYVHVHEGGQAVVAGTINQNGGRQNLESPEQPYGAEATAPCAALPSPDSKGNGVPVSGNAERQMSPARGQEPRATER
jgi:hypothetical protein